MTVIERSALVPYSARQMYELVDDIERYPEYMQGCQAAEVIERNDNELIGRLTLGKAGIRQSFTTRNRLMPYQEMEMSLVEGPFTQFGARWQFQELTEQACKVMLRMEFAFSGGLVGMALEKLFNHSASALVDDVVQRADSLYGKQTSGDGR